MARWVHVLSGLLPGWAVLDDAECGTDSVVSVGGLTVAEALSGSPKSPVSRVGTVLILALSAATKRGPI